MNVEIQRTPGWRIAAYVVAAGFLFGASVPSVAESKADSASPESSDPADVRLGEAASAVMPVAVSGAYFEHEYVADHHDHDHDHGDHADVDYGDFLAPSSDRIEAPMPGFAAPYHSYDNMVRGFDAARCTHQGVDIGGVGEYWGIGTPVRAIVKSRVVFVGTPETNPSRFGRRATRGSAVRGGVRIPRQMEVEGYGTVFPFVRSIGSARTGVFIVTKAIGTQIDGYSVRYMHLATPHPDLKVGDVIEAGQEIGLMGATGTRSGMPHVHLDIEKPSGVRVDPAPLIGAQHLLPSRCRGYAKRAHRAAKRKRARLAAKARAKARATRRTR